MNAKEQLIMEEYREAKPDFERLEKEVAAILQDIADSCNIQIYAINHRIKEEKSLAGKLERKGDKYSSLSDITDILGTRVVCFFSDDVDKLAAQVEKRFEVDWNESIDKRKYLNVNTFGYLSVHYICSLKADGKYAPELLNKRFEVQMCSLMQHIWAVMEHDLGYKTKFGVPTAVKRDFFRLASSISNLATVHGIADNTLHKAIGKGIKCAILPFLFFVPDQRGRREKGATHSGEPVHRFSLLRAFCRLQGKAGLPARRGGRKRPA